MSSKTHRPPVLWLSLLLLVATTIHYSDASSSLVISEVAPKGSLHSPCEDGNDWIELWFHTNSNDGGDDNDNVLDLYGYAMHDDKGMEHLFEFPPGRTLGSNERLVLCCEVDNDPWSPPFSIGREDTLTLLHKKTTMSTTTNSSSTFSATTGLTQLSRNRGADSSSYMVQSVVGPFQDVEKDLALAKGSLLADRFQYTYALVEDTKNNATSLTYEYTSTPTPGQVNQITPLATITEELVSQIKSELRQQNELGTSFFGMDDQGLPVPDAMDPVLELQLTMEADDYAYTMQNASFELYRPVQSVTVTTVNSNKSSDPLTVVTGTNIQIRPKGQTGLRLGICVGTKALPFQLDFGDDNGAATSLFGAQRVFLRHHMGDYSYQREWAYMRALARFGLPHLRARKVLLSINGQRHGLYTLLEAPDQPYVMARSFPNLNLNQYALYKVKWFSRGCGQYTQDELIQAQTRLDATAEDEQLQPYSFERGEHVVPPPVYGMHAAKRCVDDVVNNLHDQGKMDVVLAYLRHNQDCGDTLLDEELIDLDLGTSDWDDDMKDFIRQHLSSTRCHQDCLNQGSLKDQVDLENVLKTFAFYAVALSMDSPINNGNNYYLAQTGDPNDANQWKMVAYDLNAARSGITCNDAVCNNRIIHWSIARPTCQSLEDNPLVGPLLSDAALHHQYLEYVQEFTETIYSNASFIAELTQHAKDIDKYVREDYWSLLGFYFDNELSWDAAEKWNTGQFPLLPMMHARTNEVREQLQAIAYGDFPRGPHVGVLGDNEPWETCADWRAREPDRTKCHLECLYEGCHMADWLIPSFCDESDGTCYHGEFDENCQGITDGDSYDGMLDTEDGRKTFCRMAKGLPVRTSICPNNESIEPSDSESFADTLQQVVGFIQSFRNVNGND